MQHDSITVYGSGRIEFVCSSIVSHNTLSLNDACSLIFGLVDVDRIFIMFVVSTSRRACLRT